MNLSKNTRIPYTNITDRGKSKGKVGQTNSPSSKTINTIYPVSIGNLIELELTYILRKFEVRMKTCKLFISSVKG